MGYKADYSYCTDSFYRSYKQNSDYAEMYGITIKMFKDIINDYFKYLMSEILIYSREVRLPARMGYLSVVKTKPARLSRNTLRVDFKTTMEMEKTILHLNEHSNGYNYRFYWRKNNMLITNKTMYELVMSRANKRNLAYLIKNKLNDYIEL